MFCNLSQLTKQGSLEYAADSDGAASGRSPRKWEAHVFEDAEQFMVRGSLILHMWRESLQGGIILPRFSSH